MGFWSGHGGAALISAAGSFGSGLFGGLFAAGSQRRQYQYNLNLQRQQQAWQKAMWDLENQYNLPKNEIQRLLDAGVNPALAFNNAGASAAPVPNSGSAGGVSAPVAEMPNAGLAAVQASQASQRVENETKVADAQSDNLKAQAEATRKQAGLTESLTEAQDIQNRIARFTEPVMMRLPQVRLDSESVSLALLQNRKVRDDWDTSYHLQGIQLQQEGMRSSNRLTERNVRLATKRYDELLARIDVLEASGQLTREQANSVRLDNAIKFVSAYKADLEYKMYKQLEKQRFTRTDGSRVGFVGALAQTFYNRAVTALYETSYDVRETRSFGWNERLINYNTGVSNMVNANDKHNLSWFDRVVSSISLGLNSIDVGSQAQYRGILGRSIMDTNKTFRPIGLGLENYNPWLHGNEFSF